MGEVVKEEADKEVVVVEGEEVQQLQLDTEKYVEALLKKEDSDK